MVRLPANVVVGVVVTFTHPRARAIVPCVYVCTTVNITHPPGATFQAQLLDNLWGGCQYRTMRLRKALGEMFLTPTFLAWTPFWLWRYRAWQNRSRGVWLDRHLRYSTAVYSPWSRDHKKQAPVTVEWKDIVHTWCVHTSRKWNKFTVSGTYEYTNTTRESSSLKGVSCQAWDYALALVEAEEGNGKGEMEEKKKKRLLGFRQYSVQYFEPEDPFFFCFHRHSVIVAVLLK